MLLEICADENQVHMAIQDDGQGFDPERVRAHLKKRLGAGSNDDEV